MFDKPKVIHVPLEIAGQVGLICHYLRQYGYQAMGFNYFHTFLKYENIFHTDVYELIKTLDKFISYYDIFHFHNSYSIIEGHRDLKMITKAGKKMIMHHRGNDVRLRDLSRKGDGYYNPYVNADSSLPDAQIKENLEFFATIMDAAIVQDYELYKYVAPYYQKQGKPIHVLPRLIDTKVLQPYYPNIATKCPTIVHAPTQRDFKGSDVVEATIEKLQKNFPLRYIRIEGMSHELALKHYVDADIIIDQILCGAYGNLSVEAMALGKPVLCYIRPDLLATYPDDLPIVSSNPDNLFEQLRDLIQNPLKRHYIGRLGRAFVKKHHEGSNVIKQLIAIYDQL